MQYLSNKVMKPHKREGKEYFYGSSTLQGVPSTRGLGWVDLNFDCSTVFPILHGLIGILQKCLGKRVEHQNQSTQPGSTSRWNTLHYSTKFTLVNHNVLVYALLLPNKVVQFRLHREVDDKPAICRLAGALRLTTATGEATLRHP